MYYLATVGTIPKPNKYKRVLKIKIAYKWSGNILLPKYKKLSNHYKNYCYRYYISIKIERKQIFER